MRIIIAKNYDEMSEIAAFEVAKNIKENPEIVLGLATGGTPVGMYRELIKSHEKEGLNFSKVKSVNLDEYVGLSGENKESYRYFMDNHLFNHVNIDINNTFVPNGLAHDIYRECREYDKKIEELGGIGLQVLGVGGNGHIGFNEPNDFLEIGTHVADLKKETVEANARFFDSINEVPKQAITMGIGAIMKSKKILLMASGEEKAEAIKSLLSGEITTKIPVTMLQIHRDVTVIVDEAAGKFIK